MARLAALLGVLAGSLILPAAAGAETKTYFFTGHEQLFEVPSWVQHIDVTATGAAGAAVGSVPGGGGRRSAAGWTCPPATICSSRSAASANATAPAPPAPTPPG